MSAETQLNAALLAAAPVTGLVGAGANARIYPDEIPQETDLPAVAFFRTATEMKHTIHSAAPVVNMAMLQVYCLGASRAQAEDLCDKVLAAAADAGFIAVDRAADVDAGEGVWASVLTVRFFSTT